jgi:quercetin dioxygenase-like cupin family protein
VEGSRATVGFPQAKVGQIVTASPSEDRTASHPLDAMTASKANHSVMLENDRVRVLDTWIAPGDRTDVHAHEWPSTLYILSWSPFVRYDLAGNMLVDARNLPSQPAAGSILWSEPLPPHYVENVGDCELRVIAVELKGG